jgi:hypothetical protein
LVSCSRAEEECRNVVAECLGRLALLHPAEVLARLRTGATAKWMGLLTAGIDVSLFAQVMHKMRLQCAVLTALLAVCVKLSA